MGSNQSVSVEDQLFNMSFTAKQMKKQSEKVKKEELKAKEQAANYLRQNLRDSAQAYAQLSIAKHNQSIQIACLAAKLDIICSQLKMQMMTQQVAESIGKLNTSIQQALQQMDAEKVSKIMDEFVKNDDQLNTNTELMRQLMDVQQAGVAAPMETQSLLAQIAFEQKIDVQDPDLKAKIGEKQQQQESEKQIQ